MSCGCGCGSAGACASVLTPAQFAGSLGQRLINTVDCARDMYTKLGLRTYQVQLIWTEWTGAERGAGVESVKKCVKILPTPLVTDISGVKLDLRPVGMIEAGGVFVQEISGRLTEDLLMGRECLGVEIPDNVNFYWEVYYPQSAGFPIRRRFFPASVPVYKPEKFQWRVFLNKISEDRLRTGEPVG